MSLCCHCITAGHGSPSLTVFPCGAVIQINTCRKVPLQVNFVRWRHFALPSLILIFLRCRLSVQFLIVGAQLSMMLINCFCFHVFFSLYQSPKSDWLSVQFFIVGAQLWCWWIAFVSMPSLVYVRAPKVTGWKMVKWLSRRLVTSILIYCFTVW